MKISVTYHRWIAKVNEIGKHASVGIMQQTTARKIFTFHNAATQLILPNCFYTA